MIIYDRKEIKLFYYLKKNIKDLQQSVYDKIKKNDFTLRNVTLREVKEEIGLKVIRKDL